MTGTEPAGAAAAAGADAAADAVEVATYRRDGVVVVRGVLDAGEVELARDAIEAVLASPGPLAQVASGSEDRGRFFEDFRRWQDVAGLERLATSSRVPQVAAALLGASEVRFYHDHVLVKESGTEQRTPWHQDQPYYNVDGRGVSAWIPVDPVPLAGSLQVVAGTHTGRWYLPRTFLAKEAKWFPEGALGEVPDVDADPGSYDVRAFAMEPGDAVFFDFLALHGAPGFPFGGRRRVLSLRYLSDDARHAPRPWRTSPPFDGLEKRLAAGAPLDDPLFPVVWRSAA